MYITIYIQNRIHINLLLKKYYTPSSLNNTDDIPWGKMKDKYSVIAVWKKTQQFLRAKQEWDWINLFLHQLQPFSYTHPFNCFFSLHSHFTKPGFIIFTLQPTQPNYIGKELRKIAQNIPLEMSRDKVYKV